MITPMSVVVANMMLRQVTLLEVVGGRLYEGKGGSRYLQTVGTYCLLLAVLALLIAAVLLVPCLK